MVTTIANLSEDILIFPREHTSLNTSIKETNGITLASRCNGSFRDKIYDILICTKVCVISTVLYWSIYIGFII